MLLKSLKCLILTGLAVSASGGRVFAQSSGGTSDGGGGKAVVCRNTNGSIKSVELLDLWEARVIFGRKILKSTAPALEQYRDAVRRTAGLVIYETIYSGGDEPVAPFRDLLDSTNIMDFPEYQQDVLNPDSFEIKRLHNIKLPLTTDDSPNDPTPADCGIEQVVIWKDNGVDIYNRAYMDADLFDHMDATNQAALALHEGYYRSFRPNEMTSLRVRRIVGLVMSGGVFESFTNYYNRFKHDFYVLCSTFPKPKFDVFGHADGNTEMTRLLIADYGGQTRALLQTFKGTLMFDFQSQGTGGFEESNIWMKNDHDNAQSAKSVAELWYNWGAAKKYTTGQFGGRIDFDTNGEWKFELKKNERHMKVRLDASPNFPRGSDFVDLRCRLYKNSN